MPCFGIVGEHECGKCVTLSYSGMHASKWQVRVAILFSLSHSFAPVGDSGRARSVVGWHFAIESPSLAKLLSSKINYS